MTSRNEMKVHPWDVKKRASVNVVFTQKTCVVPLVVVLIGVLILIHQL